MNFERLRCILCVCTVAIAGLSTSPNANAGLITLGVTQDVRLETFGGVQPLGPLLSVFNTGANNQRSLLQFDFSAIPTGQQIDSAVLTLFANTTFGGNPNNLPMTVHQVTKPWFETQATWIVATTGNNWTTQGGDHLLTAVATSNANPANNQPVTWDIKSLVQDWYDGSAINYGLLLKSPQGNQLTFHSSNVSDSNLHPRLVVNFSDEPIVGSPVPEPSSLALFAVGGLIGCVAYRRRQRSLVC